MVSGSGLRVQGPLGKQQKDPAGLPNILCPYYGDPQWRVPDSSWDPAKGQQGQHQGFERMHKALQGREQDLGFRVGWRNKT